MYEREKEPLLRADPSKTPGAYWLAGYKAGYSGQQPIVPAGRQAAENYLKGFAAGVAARKF